MGRVVGHVDNDGWSDGRSFVVVPVDCNRLTRSRWCKQFRCISSNTCKTVVSMV
jgi:hypothetical protein